MPGYDIIAIGASAGGVEALLQIVRDLPKNLPAAVFVVLHVPAQAPSLLPEILRRAGRLPATHPSDNTPIRHGHIYVAPPDFHLLVEQGHVRITRGPKENRHRPAVDPLFRSAARSYSTRVVGVILTGALDDGTAGLLAVKRCGGIAVVQNPEEALYPGMPRSAMEHVQVDYCVSLSEMGQLLTRLAHEPAPQGSNYPLSEDLEKEVRISERETNALDENGQIGKPSAFACPECGGVLWEVQDGDMLRFRCRVRHAFTAESVLADQDDELEKALWMALRTLEERVDLSRRVAQHAREHGRTWLARNYEQNMREAQKNAETLRALLIKRNNGAARKDGPAQGDHEEKKKGLTDS